MNKIKRRFSINDPTSIIVYFYEGNDVNNKEALINPQSLDQFIKIPELKI